MARTLDACGGAWALHYSEIEDWLDQLVDLLDAAPQPPRAYVHHPSVITDASAISDSSALFHV